MCVRVFSQFSLRAFFLLISQCFHLIFSCVCFLCAPLTKIQYSSTSNFAYELHVLFYSLVFPCSVSFGANKYLKPKKKKRRRKQRILAQCILLLSHIVSSLGVLVKFAFHHHIKPFTSDFIIQRGTGIGGAEAKANSEQTATSDQRKKERKKATSSAVVTGI